jgi:hypothetical protein
MILKCLKQSFKNNNIFACISIRCVHLYEIHTIISCAVLRQLAIPGGHVSDSSVDKSLGPD